jgi:hypothetical protein
MPLTLSDSNATEAATSRVTNDARLEAHPNSQAPQDPLGLAYGQGPVVFALSVQA